MGLLSGVSMLLGVLKLVPELKLDTTQCAPGAQLEGTVICAAEDQVVVKEVWVNFEGAASLTGTFKETHVFHKTVPYTQTFNDTTPTTVVTNLTIQIPEVYTRTYCKTSKLASTAVCVRAEPTTLTQGVNTVPFAIQVPYDYDGVALAPSFDCPELDFHAQYSAEAVLKVNALVQRKDKQQVRIVCPATNSPVDHVVKSRLKVGTWNKDSTRPWQAIKYYMGVNTATKKSDIVLSAKLQDLTLDREATLFLPDLLQLAMTPGGESIPEQLFVDRIRVKLYSEVLDRDKGMVTSKHHHCILDARDVDLPVSFATAKSEVNITSVLGRARIPSTLAPTLDTPRFHIRHWVDVHVGIRSWSPDGTRQVVADKTLGLPVSVVLV